MTDRREPLATLGSVARLIEHVDDRVVEMEMRQLRPRELNRWSFDYHGVDLGVGVRVAVLPL